MQLSDLTHGGEDGGDAGAAPPRTRQHNREPARPAESPLVPLGRRGRQGQRDEALCFLGPKSLYWFLNWAQSCLTWTAEFCHNLKGCCVPGQTPNSPRAGRLTVGRQPLCTASQKMSQKAQGLLQPKNKP